MNRISKSLLTVIFAGLMALAAIAHAATSEDSAFCSCEEQVELNTNLPLSHPINRCATQQKTSVSWSSWFAGKSRSSQFHYLDLLELLTRGHDSSSETRAEHSS